jgi:hypothetical protein
VQATNSHGNGVLPLTTTVQRFTAASFGVVVLGLAFCWLYASQFDVQPASVVLSVAAMVGVASLVIGGQLGFVFGVPKALQESKPTSAGGYQSNTNLEQISDWLTKILVGVGLTQIGQLSGELQRLSNFLSPGLGGKPSAQSFGLVIVLYFSVSGFLISYLATRLLLGRLFLEADTGAIVNRQLDEREARDTQAQDLINSQLNPSANPVDESVLNQAIAAASDGARQLILSQAEAARRTGWQLGNKAAVERTIPVFKALIAQSPKDHQLHGQLGYALKDKQPPDWAAAEAELTKAIDLRGEGEREGWTFYEFNRALCRINQDPDYLKKGPSKPAQVDLIMKDLKVSAANSYVVSMMFDTTAKGYTSAIADWMQLNSITRDQLRN